MLDKRVCSILLCTLLCLPAVARETTEQPSDLAPDALEADTWQALQPPPDPFARDSCRIDPVVCPFRGEIEYEPGDITCGLLEVPENREDPDSRFIELHFVKLSSRWDKDEDEGEKGDMLNLFYDNPTAEPDLSCVAEMEEPRIWAPLYVSRIVPKLLALAAEDKKKLAIPGGWAGASILVSLIAFLVLTFAPPIRWLDGSRPIKAGAARISAWLAATASVAAVGVLAAAIAMTAEASEIMPLFGFVPWARYGAWCGVAAGVLGLLTLLATYRARRERGLPGSRAAGFALTGIAAMSLSAFMLFWGLGPF